MTKYNIFKVGSGEFICTVCAPSYKEAYRICKDKYKLNTLYIIVLQAK